MPLGLFTDGEGGDCRAVHGGSCVTGVGGNKARRRRRRRVRYQGRARTRARNENGDESGDESEDDEAWMAGSNRLKENVRDKAEGLMGMLQWLDAVTGRCAVCYIKWRQWGEP